MSIFTNSKISNLLPYSICLLLLCACKHFTKQNNATTTSTFGPDDRIELKDSSLHNYIGKLHVKLSQKDEKMVPVCTAFILKSRLATASHCIDKDFHPNNHIFQTVNGKYFNIEGVYKADKAADITLLTLKDAPAGLALNSYDNNLDTSMISLNNDSNKLLVEKNDPKKRAIFLEQNGAILYHWFDTSNSSSGSPILQNGKVVAMHVGALIPRVNNSNRLPITNLASVFVRKHSIDVNMLSMELAPECQLGSTCEKDILDSPFDSRCILNPTLCLPPLAPAPPLTPIPPTPSLPPTKMRHSIRNSQTPVEDQLWRNTCTTFAVMAAIQAKMKGSEFENLSEQFMAHQLPFDGPHWASQLMKFISENKIVMKDSDCIYHGAKDALGREVPCNSPNLYRISTKYNVITPNVLSIINEIENGRPVVGSVMTMGEQWGRSSPGTISLGSSLNEFCGGGLCGAHTVLFTGFDLDKQILEFKNSWDSTWHNNGYGNMTIQYYETFKVTDLVTIDRVDIEN